MLFYFWACLVETGWCFNAIMSTNKGFFLVETKGHFAVLRIFLSYMLIFRFCKKRAVFQVHDGYSGAYLGNLKLFLKWKFEDFVNSYVQISIKVLCSLYLLSSSFGIGFVIFRLGKKNFVSYLIFINIFIAFDH